MKSSVNVVSTQGHRQGSASPGVLRTTAAARGDNIVAWAIWGAIWGLIAITAWVRWIMSDQFGPAPIIAGDTMNFGRLIALRILEFISTLVVVQCVWQCAIKPWKKERKVTLEGMLLLGGVIGFSADSLLNLHDFLFAFNAHSVNLGVWTAFMPFYTGGPSRYAESLLWGFPMYVYFGISASYAGCYIVSKLRQNFPHITNASAFAIAYAAFIVGDLVLENAIIRTTDAYMFTKTYEPLTLFAGSVYQFPFYESLCAGAVSLGFTMIRQSALDDPAGISMVERGAERISARYRTPTRILAVVGACGALFILAYHLPFNWLGVVGTSVIRPPSYMLPG